MAEVDNTLAGLVQMNDANLADISVTDLFNSPEIIGKSGILRITKRALVVPPSFDESRFIENVTRNRGHNLMIFKNIEEAERWLMEK